MIAVLWTLVALQGAVPPPAAAAEPAPSSTTPATTPGLPEVEPWEGAFADGLREVRRLAEAGRTDDAAQVAERLVARNALARRADLAIAEGGWRAPIGRAIQRGGEALDLLGPPPAVRAEAWHARAVALRLAAERAPDDAEREVRREQARLAFEAARLLAGPGALRLDATYDQGGLALAAGEEQRARIPEIAGAGASQPAPPAPSAAPPGPGGAPAEAPDPLELARAAYLRAREHFVERLRMDWRDVDTQKNVELVQRRLRELDRIQKQREEEQKKRDEEQQDEQQNEEKQDQQKDSQEKQDPKDPQDPEAKDPGEDAQPEPPKDPGEDEKKPEKDPKQDPKQEPVDPRDLPPMSKEEMQKLLERLERIEAAQQELQEKLKRMRRVAVEKDW